MVGWNVQIEMFQIRQEQDMTMLMTFLEGQVFDNDMVRIVSLYLYSGWIVDMFVSQASLSDIRNRFLQNFSLIYFWKHVSRKDQITLGE